MTARRWARSVAAVGVLAAAWGPARAADEVEVDLVGFIYLPAGGRSVPGGGQARLEVPNDQGGPRLVFPVELTGRTDILLAGGAPRPGQLVALEGLLHQGRVRALRLREVVVVEYRGRLSLPDGPLTLPLETDRVVEVVLDGPSTVTVNFMLTPRTASPRGRLAHGQPVTLAVVNNSRVVVGLEARD